MQDLETLFARCRSRQLTARELASAVKNLLLEQHAATQQGLALLDLAQQRQPLPVTDFIQLRADIDQMLRDRALQANDATLVVSRTTVDADATLVSANQDATVIAGQDDVTVVAKNNDDTVIPGNVITKNADATLLCGSGPSADDRTRLAAAQHTDDATLMATVMATPAMQDATVLAARRAQEPTLIAPPLQSPRSGSTILEATVVMPGPDICPTPSSLPPAAGVTPDRTRMVLAGVGGIAVAIVGITLFALWSKPATGPAEQIQEAQAITPTVSARENTPALQNAEKPSLSADAPITSVTTGNGDTVMLQLEVVGGHSGQDTAASAAHVTLEQTKASGSTTAEHIVADLPRDPKGLLRSVQERIAQGYLLPAEDPGSATHALKALLAKAPDSNELADARAALSQAFLQAAKEARERGDLEGAQSALDYAYEVRLMKQ